MDTIFKDCLCKNFLAAIDMFKSVVGLCPDVLWEHEKKFFYLTYHTIIFLDYYLSSPVKEFSPLLDYTIRNADSLPSEAVDDVIPNRFYAKKEILDYLLAIRGRCQKLIDQASEENLKERWINDDEIDIHGLCPRLVSDYSLLEILFYNLRHVQHHTAQLNLLLRQKANVAVDWISQSVCSPE
jgi:hypothetical protein